MHARITLNSGIRLQDGQDGLVKSADRKPSKFKQHRSINIGKRTEWSPIRSVGVRFVNHEYDYRPT